MRKRVSIHGARGDWTAEVEGIRLAVIHTSKRHGPNAYFDPMTGAKTDGKRHGDFVAALRAHDLVVVQRDKPGTFDRDGYVGVFRFKDLAVGEDGSIRLALTERYADPKQG